MRRNTRPRAPKRATTKRDNQNGFVTLHVKGNKTFTPTAVTIYYLCSLDSDAASFGLPAFAEAAAAYFDMYRYFRVRKVSVQVLPYGVTNTTSQCGVIAHIAPGATVAPTTVLSFETPNQVSITNHPANNRPLILTNKDLSGIGQWAVTQSDATDQVLKSFGIVYLASPVNINTSFGSLQVTVDMELEFKTLLDPGTISLNFNKGPDNQFDQDDSATQTPSQRHVYGCRCDSCN